MTGKFKPRATAIANAKTIEHLLVGVSKGRGEVSANHHVIVTNDQGFIKSQKKKGW